MLSAGSTIEARHHYIFCKGGCTRTHQVVALSEVSVRNPSCQRWRQCSPSPRRRGLKRDCWGELSGSWPARS